MSICVTKRHTEFGAVDLKRSSLRYYLIDEGRYTDEELISKQTPLSGVLGVENAGHSWEALQQALVLAAFSEVILVGSVNCGINIGDRLQVCPRLGLEIGDRLQVCPRLGLEIGDRLQVCPRLRPCLKSAPGTAQIETQQQ
ncbi:hypothetical protein MELB17_08191 [Marinobacter sp. ELB17]|nr:hypothetical protein MELB17_08191 [Marinobacter sp. ELB17]